MGSESDAICEVKPIHCVNLHGTLSVIGNRSLPAFMSGILKV